MGCTHDVIVTGGGPASIELEAFLGQHPDRKREDLLVWDRPCSERVSWSTIIGGILLSVQSPFQARTDDSETQLCGRTNPTYALPAAHDWRGLGLTRPITEIGLMIQKDRYRIVLWTRRFDVILLTNHQDQSNNNAYYKTASSENLGSKELACHNLGTRR